MRKRSTAIIIATYLRPLLLKNCVDSVLKGDMLPDKIVIAHRDTDELTQSAIDDIRSEYSSNEVKIIKCTVTEPGHIPPIESSLNLIEEELTIILDDDTEVKKNWFRELLSPFDNEEVGVVGGQVFTPSVPTPKLKGKPGTINWYGRYYGNIGWVKSDNLLEVDTVMEGNSAWRTQILKSISIPKIFREDVSPLYGLYLTLTFKKLGYKIIYNSKAYVDHFNGVRAPNLKRDLERLKYGNRNYFYISYVFFHHKSNCFIFYIQHLSVITHQSE